MDVIPHHQSDEAQRYLVVLRLMVLELGTQTCVLPYEFSAIVFTHAPIGLLTFCAYVYFNTMRISRQELSIMLSRIGQMMPDNIPEWFRRQSRFNPFLNWCVYTCMGYASYNDTQWKWVTWNACRLLQTYKLVTDGSILQTMSSDALDTTGASKQLNDRIPVPFDGIDTTHLLDMVDSWLPRCYKRLTEKLHHNHRYVLAELLSHFLPMEDVVECIINMRNRLARDKNTSDADIRRQLTTSKIPPSSTQYSGQMCTSNRHCPYAWLHGQRTNQCVRDIEDMGKLGSCTTYGQRQSRTFDRLPATATISMCTTRRIRALVESVNATTERVVE